jgi:hypothetical protein
MDHMTKEGAVSLRFSCAFIRGVEIAWRWIEDVHLPPIAAASSLSRRCFQGLKTHLHSVQISS